MIYKCRNCGANTVWNPDKGLMCCPHCDGEESEEKITNDNLEVCLVCGAPVKPQKYDSATKCEHCGSYMIFDDRVSGAYEPHLILPFMIGKEKAKDIIRNEFGRKIFLPSTFLKEAYLDKMEGDYVPFYLFDFDCNYRYIGKGKKVRRWTSGNTEYIETSIYQIRRNMDVSFDRIPTDASLAMPDGEMDLLEPYDYKAALRAFDSKYMSGFLAEYYSVSKESLEPRAKTKARNDAKSLMMSSISGYNSVVPEMDDLRIHTVAENYTLLPVWNYVYNYRGKNYTFRLNGQTGKLIGRAPVSIGKVFGYGATLFVSLTAILTMLCSVLGVM